MIVLSANAAVLWFAWAAVASAGDIKVHVSWGHRATESHPYYVRFDAQEVALGGHVARDMETGDTVSEGVCTTTAGAGDVDGVSLELSFADIAVREIDNLHSIWAYLIEHGDAGAAPLEARSRVSSRSSKTDGLPGRSRYARFQPDRRSTAEQSGLLDAGIGRLYLRRRRAAGVRRPSCFVEGRACLGPRRARARGDARGVDRQVGGLRRSERSRITDMETNWLGTRGHLTGLIARHGATLQVRRGPMGSCSARPRLAAQVPVRSALGRRPVEGAAHRGRPAGAGDRNRCQRQTLSGRAVRRAALR